MSQNNEKQRIATKKNVTKRSLENKILEQYPMVFLKIIQPPSFVIMALIAKINKKTNNNKQRNNKVLRKQKIRAIWL